MKQLSLSKWKERSYCWTGFLGSQLWAGSEHGGVCQGALLGPAPEAGRGRTEDWAGERYNQTVLIQSQQNFGQSHMELWRWVTLQGCPEREKRGQAPIPYWLALGCQSPQEAAMALGKATVQLNWCPEGAGSRELPASSSIPKEHLGGIPQCPPQGTSESATRGLEFCLCHSVSWLMSGRFWISFWKSQNRLL